MQRMLLTLYHLDEMPIGEIAAMTGGRTFTNVNKHLVKARTAIRRANAS